jgi:hypothetical protein
MTGSQAAGPLVVSDVNPRYFTIGSDSQANGPVVYLTGSHFNNNFHDGMGPGKKCADTPEVNDYGAYLEFLKEYRLNFIRLWRWEHFKSQLPGGQFHWCMSPQPWPRTGPGNAKDGNPKFDLEKFDQAYYDRLRERVAAAGAAGIYVSIMLFEGFGLHLSLPPDNIEGHPFHAANNINTIGIASIADYQVIPLDGRVQALQEAHIRKVVDTVHDLPNVLYEVANESSGVAAESVQLPDGTKFKTRIGDSTPWQYWVIQFVKEYERQMGYAQHPVGMTFQYPVADQNRANDRLFNGPADWISPGFDESLATAKKGEGPTPGRWLIDPPANSGTKVVISDTDHYSPDKADALWAWKSFLRGHNPILYDFGIMDVANRLQPPPGLPPYAALEPARNAMGDTRRYAERIDLRRMVPNGQLSSTGYALAHAATEYLVLQPNDSSDAFTVTLATGAYTVEWFGVTTRETVEAAKATVANHSSHIFQPPFPGPAVLFLRRFA